MDYITEKYMGKSPTLLQAEKVLGQLVSEIKANPLKDYTNHPLNAKLAELITKQFGFKKTFIEWNRTPRFAPNAMTLFSVDVLLNPMTRMKASKTKGYYGNGTHQTYIVCSATMVSQLDLSTEELMALLMHEIGHNFDLSPYMLLSIATQWIKVTIDALNTKVIDPTTGMMIPAPHSPLPAIATQIFTMTPIGKDIYGFIKKIWEYILDALPFLKKINYLFNEFIAFLMKVMETTFSGIALLTAPIEILMSPVYHFITIPVRKGEAFADSFAATYGYGKPLHTALTKMGMSNMIKEKTVETSIRVIARDLVMLNRDLVGYFLNDHGSDGTRLMSNIQHLKAEVNSSTYPPSMKQELQQQISDMEKMYKDYVSMDNSKKYVVTAWARKVMYDICNGRTDFIAKLFPDIKTTWESAESYQDAILAYYESCKRGEISEEIRDKFIALYE